MGWGRSIVPLLAALAPGQALEGTARATEAVGAPAAGATLAPSKEAAQIAAARRWPALRLSGALTPNALTPNALTPNASAASGALERSANLTRVVRAATSWRPFGDAAWLYRAEIWLVAEDSRPVETAAPALRGTSDEAEPALAIGAAVRHRGRGWSFSQAITAADDLLGAEYVWENVGRLAIGTPSGGALRLTQSVRLGEQENRGPRFNLKSLKLGVSGEVTLIPGGLTGLIPGGLTGKLGYAVGRQGASDGSAPSITHNFDAALRWSLSRRTAGRRGATFAIHARYAFGADKNIELAPGDRGVRVLVHFSVPLGGGA